MGLEGAGTVAKVGANVSELEEGDRVAFAGVPGAYAEYVVAPADRLVKVPESVELTTAAALMLQGMTAHYLVDSTYPLRADDTCLVHAVAGGVGLLLTQLAKARGATVIGTTSTEEKAERARKAGADHVILYTREDFVAKTKAFTQDGDGVQVVYDSVGKTTFEGSLDCLAKRGYLVLFGQSSGNVEPLDPQVLNSKGSLFLTRPSLFHYVAERDELVRRASELFDMVGEGQLDVHVDSVFALKDVWGGSYQARKPRDLWQGAARALEGRRKEKMKSEAAQSLLLFPFHFLLTLNIQIHLRCVSIGEAEPQRSHRFSELGNLMPAPLFLSSLRGAGTTQPGSGALLPTMALSFLSLCTRPIP